MTQEYKDRPFPARGSNGLGSLDLDLKMEENPANVNMLCIARKTDMGESTSVHATEVTVSRID